MKISEMMEATNKLEAYLNKNRDQFQVFDDIYVFLWTDRNLRALIKAGVNTNDDLSSATTPGEIGIGIVNASTGDICIGAIDSDYDALWASSDDVSDFFVSTKNKKLIRLPNRLQNLADLLTRNNSEDKQGGVDAILKYIEEEGCDSIDIDQISNMTSGQEVKEYLENELDNAKSDLEKIQPEVDKLYDLIKILSVDKQKNREKMFKIGDKIRQLEGINKDIVNDANRILKQDHLFKDSDSDDEDFSTVDDEITKWTKNFKRDFPNLGLKDAREFDPNL